MRNEEGLKNDIKSIYDVIEVQEKQFKESNWVIPSYQRGYSWDKNNINGFIETLETLTQKDGSIKFFGQMIFHKGENGNLEIVDGQQRLTTYLILAKVMYEYFEDKGEELYDEFEKEKLKDYLYLSTGKPRFSHQINNKRVIDEYIYLLEPENGKEDDITNLYNEYVSKLDNSEQRKEYREKLYSIYKKKRRIKKEYFESIVICHKKITNFFVENFFNDPDGVPKKNYHNFRTNIFSDSIILTSILTFKSFDTAYEAFMTLNSKGKSLTEYDLIRSEFIGNIGKRSKFRDDIEKDWNMHVDREGLSETQLVNIFGIMLKIEYKDNYFSITNVLGNTTSKRTLLRDILVHLSREIDIEEVYKSYKNYIEKYIKMKLGEFSSIMGYKYKEYDDEVKSTLEMDYTPFQPLLFEIIKYEEEFDDSDIIKVLNIVRYIPFIYVTVCGLRPSHLADEMKTYLETDGKKSEKLDIIIKNICSENTLKIFDSSFCGVKFKDNAVSKDVLLLLENFSTGNKYHNHLEHMYPQKPKNTDWKQFDDRNATYLIGNQYIVSKDLNEKMNNKSFEDKMHVIREYVESGNSIKEFNYLSKLYDMYKKGNKNYCEETIEERSIEYKARIIEKFKEMKLFSD